MSEREQIDTRMNACVVLDGWDTGFVRGLHEIVERGCADEKCVTVSLTERVAGLDCREGMLLCNWVWVTPRDAWGAWVKFDESSMRARREMRSNVYHPRS